MLAVIALPVKADNETLLCELDSLLDNVGQLYTQKQSKIEMLKQAIASHRHNDERTLDIYHQIYEEYYVFDFDSAMVYASREIELSKRLSDKYHRDMARIAKAELLSIKGFYPEALQCLQEVNIYALAPDLKLKYYIVTYQLYLLWADYCNDEEYKPKYLKISCDNLQKVVSLLDEDDLRYHYMMGEYYNHIKKDDKKSLYHYLKVLTVRPVDSREYAQASYSAAIKYLGKKDMQKYEEYIIRACISDLKNCTRENLAIQDLAMFLYNKEHQDISRADRYIHFAMEEAKSLNNRLRLIELSQKFPTIVSNYREKITKQNRMLSIILVCLSLLTGSIAIMLYFFVRQNKQLSLHKKTLSSNNDLLHSLNGRLHSLNERLLTTNARRERLAKLYIDLCTKYIDKLTKFETLVRRKIKAGQVQELLSMTSASRLSQDDASTFIAQFDKAFLDLYPTFVEEFNRLLKEEEQITPIQNGRLTTELRIFALVRLGVKESAEIAALLFYTPRTIYNYRSAFKNKVKDKETFESDVMRLCTVI